MKGGGGETKYPILWLSQYFANSQEPEPLKKKQDRRSLLEKNRSRSRSWSQSCLGKRNFRFLTGQIFNQYGTLSRHYALCIGADEIYPYLLLFLLLFSALIVNNINYRLPAFFNCCTCELELQTEAGSCSSLIWRVIACASQPPVRFA